MVSDVITIGVIAKAVLLFPPHQRSAVISLFLQLCCCSNVLQKQPCKAEQPGMIGQANWLHTISIMCIRCHVYTCNHIVAAMRGHLLV